jgi:inorganic phosphate transporter, PiT family
MTLVLCVVVFGLVFEYINGFHDTANSIATVVSTRVLRPRQAVFMAAVCNLIGALWGTAVATTIGNGLVETSAVTLHALLAAVLAAIFWNLLTWWLGLPSSSSHALIGGLCGATLAAARNDFSIVKWYVAGPHGPEGLLPKVVLPMVISPLVGLVLGFLVMGLLLLLLRNWRPRQAQSIFGRLQLVSSSLMAFSHGTNDAQKTMGLIALTLWTATQTNLFADLPPWLAFLHTPKFEVAFWVKATCSITMALGTAAGGWRIIRTLGHRLVKLQRIHGFAVQTTAASVIQVASHWGIPLSTTHVISASIMGVGATRQLNAVKWSVVGQMVWAWVLTLPATALLGYLLERLLLLLQTGPSLGS